AICAAGADPSIENEDSRNVQELVLPEFLDTRLHISDNSILINKLHRSCNATPQSVKPLIIWVESYRNFVLPTVVSSRA
ncbi:MAG: hypothetical protein JWN43_754, partial [Gammaproteobacteria bacterium]|nr:hypothetical protein [Gammaproteobacteria bacterium]